LPLGTANDFARSIGLPSDDVGAALELVASGAPSRIDIGIVDGRPFINMVSGGFGSRVTAETDQSSSSGSVALPIFTGSGVSMR
jgi:diacylglycerol kinase family enzyme